MYRNTSPELYLPIIDMPKFTRKAGSKGHSFPDIRKKLDVVREKALQKTSPEDFSKLWKKMFGKPLSIKLAKEYLDIVRRTTPQTGGSAPVSYDMRMPDVATSTVPYVSGGFGFANMMSVPGGPKEYLSSSPVPPNATNHVGGKRKATRKAKQKGGSQPFGANIPPTTLQTVAMLSVGRGLPTSPLPEVPTSSVYR